MLSAEFLLYITDKAERAAEKLNIALTERIAKRIRALFDKTGKVELIPSSISDVRKAKEAGAALEDIQEELNRQLLGLQKEIKEAFEAAASEIALDNNRFTEIVAKSVGENIDLTSSRGEVLLTKKEKALLQRAYEKTNGTLNNLTGTTASAWQKEFIRVTDEAYWKATHGVSLDSAISDAINEAAKYGCVVEYPSGHVDKIEVAVARAVRTGINQAAGDIALARCAEQGVSRVLVSSHLGARYTDKDEPANHMSWQGKVYSLDWNSDALSKYQVTEQDDEDNERKFGFLKKIRQKISKKFVSRKDISQGDFVTITGYGTGEGLCGWNCRHTFSPFYEGMNINNAEQFDSEESKKRYDAEQKQRAMERAMRSTRRQLAAKKAQLEEDPENETVKAEYDALKKKLSDQGEAYAKFSNDNGLALQYERTKTPGYGGAATRI